MILRRVVVAMSFVSFAIGVADLAACSSSDKPPASTSGIGTSGGTGGGGGGGGGDGGGADGGADASGTDAAPAPENGCTVFTDRTADTASRTLEWDLNIVTAPERCMKIKAGQTVTFGNGADAGADFSSHPLVIYLPKGGTAPTADQTTGQATFPAPALYGFACGIHPTMRGVILAE